MTSRLGTNDVIVDALRVATLLYPNDVSNGIGVAHAAVTLNANIADVLDLNGQEIGADAVLARGDIIIADANPNLTLLNVGAANTVLFSDGTNPAWATAATTVPLPPVAQGDMLVADAGPAWSVLTLGAAAGYALVSTATTAVWSQTPTMTGDWTWISSTSSKPVLTIENTNADGQAPTIDFYKNTASPLDGDDLGAIDFFGETSTGTKDRYAFILAESLDVTSGDTGGGLRFMVVMNAIERNLFEIAGYNGSVNQGEVIVNQAGQDVDFRVEGIGAANALFVQGSDGLVGVGTGAPSRALDVVAAAGVFDVGIFSGSHNNGMRVSIDATAAGGIEWAIESEADAHGTLSGGDFAIADRDNALWPLIIQATAPTFSLYIESSGDVGINIAAPTAQLHVDQSAAAGAKPCLILDQGDASEQCIQFTGDGADQDIFLFTVDVTGTPTLLWDESADALIISGADLHLNNGAGDRLLLRRSGNVANVEADIYAHSQLGLAADDNVHVFIDADNSSTTDYFSIQKNAENVAAATEVMRVTEAPILFLNETSNANMTIGVTLDQGASDDEIFNARSSDVGAVLSSVETNTYFTLEKVNGGAGGVVLSGFRDAGGTATAAMRILGYLAENVDTTKTQAGRAITEVVGFQTDGTNRANTVADGNVVAFRTQRGGGTVTLFIVDEDGDLFADGGIASTDMVTLFDDYKDAELVRAFDIARGPEQVIRSEFDRYIKYNESTLVEAGILGAPIADGGLINVTRLQQLHNGAIWQNYCEIRELHNALTRANEALIELGADPVALIGG